MQINTNAMMTGGHTAAAREKQSQLEKQKNELDGEIRAAAEKLKKYMELFDGKGRPAEFFRANGISFTHPSSVLKPMYVPSIFDVCYWEPAAPLRLLRSSGSDSFACYRVQAALAAAYPPF